MIILNHKINSRVLCFFSFVFLTFLSFFTLFHPLVLTTPDDWYYISYTRDAIPLLVHHNPTRILPEILMPFVATISSICFRTFCSNFSLSIAYGTGLVLAFLITIYAYNLYALIKKYYALTIAPSLCITAIFLLLHFLVLRTSNVDNPYLFGAFCLTNIYYYTICILLNATLVMYCIRKRVLYNLSTLDNWHLGVFCMIVYLCLLSNLYASIILATYFASHFLLCIIHGDGKKSFAKNKFVVSALLGYAIILLLEANGGNAKTITSHDESFFIEFRKTLGFYHTLFNQINFYFKLFTVVVGITASYIAFKAKKKELLHSAIFVCFNFGIVNLFSLLISAKAYPHYVAMEDKAFMELFWLLIAIVCSISFCIKEKPRIISTLPILFLILFFQTNTKTKTFKDVFGFYTMTPIFEDLVECMSNSRFQKVDSLTLYVPYIEEKDDNWPFPLTQGKELSNMFYSHRIIDKRIVISMKAIPGLTTFKSSIDGYNPDSIINVNPQTKMLNYYRK